MCLELMRDTAHPDPLLAWLAFGLFMVAALSDAADGYVARHFNQVTRLGRIIDPFADKILICGTLVCCLRFQAITEDPWLLQTWMVVLILAREIFVTTVRGAAEAAGVPFPADKWGKIKMVAQCIATAGLLALIAGTTIFWLGTVIALWATLFLAVSSGVEYLLRARPVMREA